MNLSKIQSNPKILFIIIGLVVVVLALAGYIIWNSFIADSDDQESNSAETSTSADDEDQDEDENHDEDQDEDENHDDDQDEDEGKEPITTPTVSAEAIDRNVRNTHRRSDIGTLKAQLYAYIANNNGRPPTAPAFGSSVLVQFDLSIYDSGDFATALVDSASERKIFYLTERPDDANLELAILPDPDTLHIIMGAECGGNELSGGNPTVGSAAAKYMAADIAPANSRAIAFIYQLEGEDNARCEDN